MLDAGVPLVSVYVTAGEHTGLNRIAGECPRPAGPEPPTPPPATRVCARRTQRSWGSTSSPPGRRASPPLRGGRRAEINTLMHGGRRVELIFLNLPEHAPRRYMALVNLWKDRALELRTHPLRGLRRPPARPQYDHDPAGSMSSSGLLDRYRPTVVHTLDPDPDIQDQHRGRPASATPSSPATPTTACTPPSPNSPGPRSYAGSPRPRRGRRPDTRVRGHGPSAGTTTGTGPRTSPPRSSKEKAGTSLHVRRQSRVAVRRPTRSAVDYGIGGGQPPQAGRRAGYGPPTTAGPARARPWSSTGPTGGSTPTGCSGFARSAGGRQERGHRAVGRAGRTWAAVRSRPRSARRR